MTEIGPLLLSNILPNDVVLGCVYKNLWKNAKVLSTEQKCSIINYDFYFNKLWMSYYNHFLLSKTKGDPCYFLIWFVNDLLVFLNDRKPVAKEISASLQQDYPNITFDFLNKRCTHDELPKRAYALWKMLNNNKKRYMCMHVLNSKL